MDNNYTHSWITILRTHGSDGDAFLKIEMTSQALYAALKDVGIDVCFSTIDYLNGLQTAQRW